MQPCSRPLRLRPPLFLFDHRSTKRCVENIDRACVGRLEEVRVDLEGDGGEPPTNLDNVPSSVNQLRSVSVSQRVETHER